MHKKNKNTMQRTSMLRCKIYRPLKCSQLEPIPVKLCTWKWTHL